jgi:CDGSH-type Zn-finger protein
LIDSETCEKQAIEMLMKPGLYKWCACGLSMTQPFCDDSHLAAGVEPVYVKINEEKIVYWCGCKATRNTPFCDGMEQIKKKEKA